MINKAAYRRRYIRLTHELDALLAGYDCGAELAGFINPRIVELHVELNRLLATIQAAMVEEGYAPTR